MLIKYQSEGSGQSTVNQTGTQSFINTVSNSLLFDGGYQTISS